MFRKDSATDAFDGNDVQNEKNWQAEIGLLQYEDSIVSISLCLLFRHLTGK